MEYEGWASKEYHLAYLKFRTDDGTIAMISQMLTGAPKFTYWNLSDA
jgi:hypothetical protein